MTRVDGGPSYEELAQAVDELREENARLRRLLGFDTRASDGHRQAWAPTLLTEPAERPAVDASAGEAEKVALLRSLFGARSDIYATRWENTSTGKSGWSPAVRGGWSKRRSSKDLLPLTDNVLLAHVRGERTLGIYPLLPSDRCGLLACDFDKGTWALDALAYLDACHANGVPAVMERSRSGNGAHVWVFFDGPVPAAEARAMGAALLRQAMTARAELDLASYDRFFPSQDFLPKAGFGNLIALPLQGGCARRGTTVFLDPASMEPWPDGHRSLAGSLSAAAGHEAAGTIGKIIVSIAAAFSAASAINATLFATARLTRRIADEGELPRFLREQNGHGVPQRAVIVLGALGTALAAIGSLGGLVEAASILVTFAAVNYLAAANSSGPCLLPATGAVAAVAAGAIVAWRLATQQPATLIALAVLALAAIAIRPFALQRVDA